MKHIACILICIVCQHTWAQPAKRPQVITRFIYMTGVIDKYPATMLLHRINEKLEGAYYYNNSEIPISLAGNIGKNNFLDLIHTGQETSDQEILSGVFKDSSFSGAWSHKGKKLNFRFTRTNNPAIPSFDYIWSKGSRKLNKKAGEFGPDELNYEAATVWPAAGSRHPANDLIEQLIREEFGEKNSREEIGAIMLKEKNELLAAATNPDEIEEYELSRSIAIEYLQPKLLCLGNATFTYAGGAHGMFGTSYTCIDLVNNRILGIADVVDTTTANPVLETLLKKEFARKYQADQGDLLVDKIPVNDNFTLTTKGIGFNYVPYEITPYAMGEIYLYISFKDIMAYLKPDFRKLIGQ